MWHYLQRSLSRRERTFFKVFLFVFALELLFILSILVLRYVTKLRIFNKPKEATVYFDLSSLSKKIPVFSEAIPKTIVTKKTNNNLINKNKSQVKSTKVKTITKEKKHSQSKQNIVKKELKTTNKIPEKVNIIKVKENKIKTKEELRAKVIKPVKQSLIKKEEKAKTESKDKANIKDKTKSQKIKKEKNIKSTKDISKNIIQNEVAKNNNSNKQDIKDNLTKDLSLDLSSNTAEASLNSCDNDVYYAQAVKKEICKNWRLPKGLPENLKAEIKYHINSEGKAEGVSIIKSSGKRSYDQLLKAAIYRSSFPKKLANLNIIIKF